MPEFKPYPGEDPEEAIERISKNIEEGGLPTSNAMDRSQTYQLGGKVKPPTAPSITPTPQYEEGGFIKKAVEKYKSKKAGKKREKARKKSVEDFPITSVVQPKTKKKDLKPAIVPSNPPLIPHYGAKGRSSIKNLITDSVYGAGTSIKKYDKKKVKPKVEGKSSSKGKKVSPKGGHLLEPAPITKGRKKKKQWT
jgi:hypothetical protein|tara:strand:+ start:354 stop:935 length:582 start_codon:yes stop_codon:yes gene_type:complete